MRRLLALGVLAFVLAVPGAAAQVDFAPVWPLPGDTVRSGTPTLVVNYTGQIDGSRLTVVIDGMPAEEEGLQVNAANITYEVNPLLKLREGNHTFLLSYETTRLEIAFVVNYTIPPEPPKPLDVRLVVLVAAGSLSALAAVGGGLYAWARRRHRFTFRKHFLRHPEQVRYLTLYVPSGLAAVAGLGALFLVATMPERPRFAFEYVLVAGAALALGPFGVASVRASIRTRACERAFAQFLFELADAVRGGIDPVKAVQELAKTQDGLLRKPLRRAADLLRLGQPMDQALRAMTAGMGSPLVSRYASLVGEASAMGGSVSGVMQRAAKDMDDLVKIKAERRRALRQPVFTMYMAFVVLLLMVLQIVGFAPNIGDLDLAALSGGKGSEVQRMGIPAMQTAFFHLLLMNAAAGGLLVGAFTEGKLRNGILHAIVMTATACVVFPLAT